MFSGKPFSTAQHSGVVSSAQQAVFDNILNSVQALGPPVGPSGPEALRKLRAFDGYGEDQNPSAVRAYDPSLLSIPSHGNNAVPFGGPSWAGRGNGGERVLSLETSACG